MSRKPTANIDYTNRDYDAFKEMLISYLQKRMPEYTDTSETDAGIIILEALANGLDILSLYMDILANDVILVTTQDRAVAILIARILGYTPYNQTTSLTKQVFVLNEEKDVDTVIPAGTILTNESLSDEILPVQFQTVENLVIPAGYLGDETDDDGNYMFTVDVAQGETVSDDVVGSSTGAPYQRFVLTYENVLVDTLRVYIQTDSMVEEWTRVNSFLDNSLNENSKVFVVNVNEYNSCEIEFGNGIRGAIPPAMEDNIICDYRVGGGVASNVAANVIVSLDETDLEFLDATFNPEASYVKGHDMETLEEIKTNAPAYFRVKDRCVTLQDYEDLFMINNEGDLYGIWRVQALNDAYDALRVQLYVHMRDGYEFTDDLMQSMSAFLDDRIIIGTSYRIHDHGYSYITLSANLRVDRDYNRALVKANVENLIYSYFEDLTIVTFDSEIIGSELEQLVITSVDGVEYFRIIAPAVDVIAPDEPQNILAIGSLNVNASGGIV